MMRVFEAVFLRNVLNRTTRTKKTGTSNEPRMMDAMVLPMTFVPMAF